MQFELLACPDQVLSHGGQGCHPDAAAEQHVLPSGGVVIPTSQRKGVPRRGDVHDVADAQHVVDQPRATTGLRLPKDGYEIALGCGVGVDEGVLTNGVAAIDGKMDIDVRTRAGLRECAGDGAEFDDEDVRSTPGHGVHVGLDSAGGRAGTRAG